MQMFRKNKIKYLLLTLFILISIYSYKIFDANQINNFFLGIEGDVIEVAILQGLLIFLLRSISIIFPILPGTYCSVLAGYLYGVKAGLLLIFIADLFSCLSSFLIARKLGRDFVRRLLGAKQMEKIETLGKKYLEKNIFLMTGLLMTQFFDFVCYSIGFTKVSWRRFTPALIISILISDVPFVAGGYALKGINNFTISDILNGSLKLIEGPYLATFLVSLVIILGLGFLNISISKRIDSQ